MVLNELVQRGVADFLVMTQIAILGIYLALFSENKKILINISLVTAGVFTISIIAITLYKKPTFIETIYFFFYISNNVNKVIFLFLTI